MITKNDFISKFSNLSFSYNRKKKRYECDAICCFDTETSSVRISGEEKMAFIYAFILSVGEEVIIVRTVEEFLDILYSISEKLQLDPKNKILIFWVHNLKFDFQFIRKYMDWYSVFALKQRAVVEAISSLGIAFRCSYAMSNKSLAVIGKEVGLQKLTGDLDYSLIRHSNTELTPKEVEYMEHDVLVLHKYIEKEIEFYGSISNLPITNTARVRNYCRDKCFEDKNYKQFISALTLTPNDYVLINEAFAGGFTHASAYYVGKTVSNVKSYDITSDYPTEMIAEYYPMSSPIRVEVKSLSEFDRKYKDKYLSVFRVQISGLREKIKYEHILSRHKCEIVGDVRVDNGRLVEADNVIVSLTNVDLQMIREFYDFDDIEFLEFVYFIKGRLPKPIIISILSFYKDKTSLKGTSDEAAYMRSKNMLNAIYGMMVTDIVRDEFLYTEEDWDFYPKKKEDFKTYCIEKIDKYNSSMNRFLFYPWGVFVTAYARRRLLKAIKHLGIRYIYSDTDSVKFNINKADRSVEDYFITDDNIMKTCIRIALFHYHIPFEEAEPKTIKGEKKPLGVWSDEGVYEKFKTLGAKRYLVQKSGHLELTVSGIPKKAVGYLELQEEPFKVFADQMVIPLEFSSKNVSVYIDEDREDMVTDYKGKTLHVKAPSGLYIEEIPATLSMSEEFLRYLASIK